MEGFNQYFINNIFQHRHHSQVSKILQKYQSLTETPGSYTEDTA